ncbi:MAG: rhodanese-like domain-containing protein, partial [Bacteroidota bacterium]
TSMYKQTVPLIYEAEVKNQGLDHFYVLDTREKKEFQVSHIPGAKYGGYLSFKKSMVKDLPRDTPILVYCSIGVRSERVGEKLKKMGFSNVQNLYGGIFDWKNNGNQVVDSEGQPTEKVHTYDKNWSQWLFKGEKIW